ncbi:MAG TPA: pyrroloquinoline quinone-dependent dehydrogenase [Steroidobacteraceae bacterium]|nr:pyrroloquinoline quinone-dependent dehydrogenase [Steroidobacteraceae bacterium]
MHRLELMAVAAGAALLCAVARAQSPETSDWGYYGGDIFGQHYSNLDQINRDNVSHLGIAWTFRTGELGAGFARTDKLTFEATPVLAFGLLYVSTATGIVVALDPETGRARWRFDPRIARNVRYAEAASRGVAVWQDPNTAAGACARRVFIATLDARLLALDAMSGTLCTDFGVSGAVDLTHGVRLIERPQYLVTSPPVIHRNLVIVGSAIGDNRAVTVERGLVRGFDARSGALHWSFDPIPDSEAHPAAKEWRSDQAARTGAGNAWAVMTVDPARGLVFVPTGSASPDFYGGERLGSNRFADSLIALDADTGRLVWQQQLVHHDLWDYDLAAQPALVALESRSGPLYAVLQATKSGMLFGFERDTGKPIFPIAEHAVPRSTVPGEQSAPTQPFPETPPLASASALDPRHAWGLTFWDRGECRDLIRRYRNEGVYTPPDTRGSIESPGPLGGVNWGGIAIDVRRERAFAAVNHLPWVIRLVPREQLGQARARASQTSHAELAEQAGTPYAVLGAPLLSPWGLPCTPPPWGTLASIDLRHNRIAWQVPLGSTAGFTWTFLFNRDFGLPNMGGPIVTAGDLVFIGAAMDSYFRAFDSETGRELWKYRLPAGGQATPMTYRAGKAQRQYVVIAAGGHGVLGTPRGDYLVAFALPEIKAASAPSRPRNPATPLAR